MLGTSVVLSFILSPIYEPALFIAAMLLCLYYYLKCD
jgi:hypothetical protein